MHPDQQQALGLLFDMDGLLVDSEPLWLQAESHVAHSLGISWSEEDQRYCLGGPLARLGAYMGDRAGVPEKSLEIANDVVDRVIVLARQGVSLMPGVRDLIDQAAEADISMALVSASPRELVDAVLSQLPVSSSFLTTIAGNEAGRTKPHPDPYLLAADRIGRAIEACIVLEDSPTGVAAGTAAGAYVVAVAHMSPIAQAPRRSVIHSLEGVSLGDLLNMAATV
jgi:HAD superfamily hydrolase (TIGR01509 family)